MLGIILEEFVRSYNYCVGVPPSSNTVARQLASMGLTLESFADEKNGHDIMLFHARNFGQLELH